MKCLSEENDACSSKRMPIQELFCSNRQCCQLFFHQFLTSSSRYFICQCFMFQFGYTFEATVGDTETVVVRKGEAAVLVKKMLLNDFLWPH